VPTSVEQGVPFTMDGWFMVIGPKGIPAEEVSRIQGAVQKAFSTKEVKDAMAAQGALANVSTSEQARAFLQIESTRFAEIVKKAEVVAQ
jgi:tripartite-type tricarboxylate transporter receptor subunit TctC